MLIGAGSVQCLLQGVEGTSQRLMVLFDRTGEVDSRQCLVDGPDAGHWVFGI